MLLTLNKIGIGEYIYIQTQKICHSIQEFYINNPYNNPYKPIEHKLVLSEIIEWTNDDIFLLNDYVKRYNLHGIKYHVRLESLWNGNSEIILVGILK